MACEQHAEVRSGCGLSHPTLLVADRDDHPVASFWLIESVEQLSESIPTAWRSCSSAKRTQRPTRDAHASSTEPKRLLVHAVVAAGAARTNKRSRSIAISSIGSSQIANVLSPQRGQANAHGARSRSEDNRRLGDREPLPGDEHQQFAVALAEGGEGTEDAGVGGVAIARDAGRVAGAVVGEPLAQGGRARVASALVGEHLAGGPQQPGPRGSGTASSRRQTTRNTSTTTSSALAAVVRRMA